MKRSQRNFGVAVGILVLCAGLSLNLAGISGTPMMVVGLVILLANAAYWLLEYSPKRIQVVSDSAKQRREQR
ncbi:hypothetical protein MO867_13970 [Microbulbifer sp. OS29]|uniref:Uncharacterized protein n=1 Tax=Microbulbifer okhotskensis TaxID=2926617 RepID=A0A9X2EPI0_9GAMM|nr:hypothetical protein [Microbulbifer okhotskensis]MCO1335441.1 hypothetical protein [Microbulbifer okhotskensis]